VILMMQERGLRCPVRACSHVGGHSYAGNVLTFSRRTPEGTVIGDWYGYVTNMVAKDIGKPHGLTRQGCGGCALSQRVCCVPMWQWRGI
jgi:hypothetical protein